MHHLATTTSSITFCLCHCSPQPAARSGSRREASKGSQTGDSLIRKFRERKDKGVFVRDRPQAYFLACEEKKETGGGQDQVSILRKHFRPEFTDRTIKVSIASLKNGS
jgi:hypothetical protein